MHPRDSAPVLIGAASQLAETHRFLKGRGQPQPAAFLIRRG
jgi:hypothetical protein